MNQKRLSVPIGIAAVAVLLIGVIYFSATRPAQAPPEESAAATSSPTTTTTAQTASYTGPKGSLSASTQGGVVPFTVVFTLRLNADRSCSPVTYTISFGDLIEKDVQVPLNQCAKPYTMTISHQYTKAGTFVATLRTKPAQGEPVQVSRLTVVAKNPVVTTGTPAKGFTVSPTSGYTPLVVKFTLAASDGSESVYYTANFGDGETANFSSGENPTLSHTYPNPGTYVVTIVRKTQCSSGTCTGPSAPVGTLNVTAI